MYGKNVLVYRVSAPVATASILESETDMDDVEVEFEDMDLINDLDAEYNIASSSNAELQLSSDFEAVVVNRLDVLSVSAILSTCFLFLLLLRHRH